MILVVKSTSKLNTIKVLLDIKSIFSGIFILSEPFNIPIDGEFTFINNTDNLSEYIYIEDTCKINDVNLSKFIELDCNANIVYASNKYDDIFILFCMITGKIETTFKEFEPDYLKCISKIDKRIMDSFNNKVIESLFKVEKIDHPKMYKYNKYKKGQMYYTGIVI